MPLGQIVAIERQGSTFSHFFWHVPAPCHIVVPLRNGRIFMSKRLLTKSAVVLCGLFFVFCANAETVWVSDEFEIMLRTGPSTSNAIERVLTSGTELEVLEKDSDAGYARVRTMGGTEGWVLTRYLMGEPAAREQLERLTSQLSNANTKGSSLSTQLESIRSEQQKATRRISDLEAEKARLETELTDIRTKSANVLSIDTQNKSLRQQLTDAEIKVSILEQENEGLSAQKDRTWFITGALVLFGGIILGLVLPRLKFQKRSRYDRL